MFSITLLRVFKDFDKTRSWYHTLYTYILFSLDGKKNRKGSKRRNERDDEDEEEDKEDKLKRKVRIEEVLIILFFN